MTTPTVVSLSEWCTLRYLGQVQFIHQSLASLHCSGSPLGDHNSRGKSADPVLRIIKPSRWSVCCRLYGIVPDGRGE